MSVTGQHIVCFSADAGRSKLRDSLLLLIAYSDKNKDCLVRVYLGERESTEQQSGIYDSLRNFELSIHIYMSLL
jgi:hypothetical protein